MLWNESVASKDDDEDNYELANGGSENLFDHLVRYNVVVSALGFSLKQGLSWRLGSKSKSSKRVHNHVKPQKLDRLERRFLQYDCAN